MVFFLFQLWADNSFANSVFLDFLDKLCQYIWRVWDSVFFCIHICYTYSSSQFRWTISKFRLLHIDHLIQPEYQET